MAPPSSDQNLGGTLAAKTVSQRCVPERLSEFCGLLCTVGPITVALLSPRGLEEQCGQCLGWGFKARGWCWAHRCQLVAWERPGGLQLLGLWWSRKPLCSAPEGCLSGAWVWTLGWKRGNYRQASHSFCVNVFGSAEEKLALVAFKSPGSLPSSESTSPGEWG